VYRYDSSTYNASYLYNGLGLQQDRAEQACRDSGGHLVAWQSQAEQSAVEQYFAGLFILNVPFVQSYWVGLATNTSRVWGWGSPAAAARPPGHADTAMPGGGAAYAAALHPSARRACGPGPTLPSRHRRYLDKSLPPLSSASGYTRWIPAANNQSLNTCAVAMWLPGRLLGSPLTWGWMDSLCSRSLPSICKVLRGCPCWLPPACWPLAPACCMSAGSAQ
jgi:hypothetical protein